MPGKPLFEKYRPKRLSEIIGQEHVTAPLQKIVEAVRAGQRDLPHMLFIGPAGVGKTTTAYALANELGWDIVELNASDERGIDVIRNKVKHLALAAGRRIILLDEADALTEDAQQALRRIMERAVGSRFILTANYEWKLIEPIRSRCAVFRFRRIPRDLMVRRLVEIIKAEGVKIPRDKLQEVKQALAIIVEVANGDMRKAINLLEEVLANKVDLTPEAVRGFVAPGVATEALQQALQGNLLEAVRVLEDSIIENRLDVDATVNMFYKAIKTIPDTSVRAKAWIALSEAERAVRQGASPLIQFAGFLATVWFYHHAVGRRR